MIDTSETEERVRAFVDGAPHVFWSVSNVGDLLITLAAAVHYPDARLVHCGRDALTDNKDQWYTFLAHWPAYFNIPFLYVADKEGRMMQAVERMMLTLPSYHPVIAPRIVERKGYAFRDPENGRDWQTLHPRIVTQTDWSDRIGTTSLFPNEKLCIICPSGSKKRRNWQRYLTNLELQDIVRLARDKGYTVVVTSHESDYLGYKMANVYWLTNDTLIAPDGTRTAVTFDEFLRILNSGQYYISMDTWLKTFVALLGKPVQMIRRRSFGQYVDFGSDPADHIFLDPRLWKDMRLVTVDEVCADLATH